MERQEEKLIIGAGIIVIIIFESGRVDGPGDGFIIESNNTFSSFHFAQRINEFHPAVESTPVTVYRYFLCRLKSNYYARRLYETCILGYAPGAKQKLKSVDSYYFCF